MQLTVWIVLIPKSISHAMQTNDTGYPMGEPAKPEDNATDKKASSTSASALRCAHLGLWLGLEKVAKIQISCNICIRSKMHQQQQQQQQQQSIRKKQGADLQSRFVSMFSFRQKDKKTKKLQTSIGQTNQNNHCS